MGAQTVAVEPASHQVEYQTVGGGKRTAKKPSKSSQVKKSVVSKQQKTKQESSEVARKQDKQGKQDKQDKQSKQSKRGGSIVNDVKNLAVPFAILLAKEGLSKMFKVEETKKASKASSKTSTLKRRGTMSGGSCNLGCSAQTGGQAAKQLFELQNEIDHFLEKY
jgi:hypothetical protein